MKRLTAALLLVLGACSGTSVEFEPLAKPLPDAPAEVESSTAAHTAAEEICADHLWAGIAEPGGFDADAARLSIQPEALTQAIRTTCPDTFYEPLSKAEVDWCGNGLGFGQNFFTVIEAGLDLGIASFTVVEPGLLSKAMSRSAEFSDYEIELFTAELQTMSESQRFERDWAEACRATF